MESFRRRHWGSVRMVEKEEEVAAAAEVEEEQVLEISEAELEPGAVSGEPEVLVVPVVSGEPAVSVGVPLT